MLSFQCLDSHSEHERKNVDSSRSYMNAMTYFFGVLHIILNTCVNDMGGPS